MFLPLSLLLGVFLFISRPTKWGRGYWRRLGCPSISCPDDRILFSEQNSVTRGLISLILDTHNPLGGGGGVDVSFEVFEFLPSELANHRAKCAVSGRDML